jgi:hypothetical protein
MILLDESISISAEREQERESIGSGKGVKTFLIRKTAVDAEKTCVVLCDGSA